MSKAKHFTSFIFGGFKKNDSNEHWYHSIVLPYIKEDDLETGLKKVASLPNPEKYRIAMIYNTPTEEDINKIRDIIHKTLLQLCNENNVFGLEAFLSQNKSIRIDLTNILDSNWETLLHVSTRNNNNEMTFYLIRAGLFRYILYPDQDKNTPFKYILKYARENNNWTVFDWVMDYLGKIADRNSIEFLDALNNLEISKEEIDKYCSRARENFLIASINTNDEREVHRLLKLGVNPNISDINGITPLHFCCHGSNPTLVELLLDNNANIGARDKDGLTSLHYAIDMVHKTESCLSVLSGEKSSIIKIDNHETVRIAKMCFDRASAEYKLESYDYARELLSQSSLTIIFGLSFWTKN